MTRKEIITAAKEQFNKYGIWAEPSPSYILDTVIEVDVTGDWKHDHIATNKVMEEYGCVLLGEQVCEDWEDDSYHSIHRYVMTAEK